MSTVQTHLSRRNAYHSTIRRAPSNASSVSSDVSSTSSSSDGDDHQLTPTTTNRHTLYLNAIEANKTAAKLDRARQRRKAARDDLQVKQEWGTGFEVLSTSPRDPYNPWGFAPEGIEVDSVALEDPQPFSPALIPLTPPRREASLGSTSPDSTPPDPPSRTPSVRPKLYPLFIPSRPDERPRSFQPISNLAQPPIADRPRPISWAGQDAQAFQLDSQSGTVDEWGTEEVVSWSRMAGYPPQVAKVLQEHHITGPVLLTLDSNRLRLMGVVAFGTRFKLLESLRELQSGATPTPVAVVPAPPAPQPDTPRDIWSPPILEAPQPIPPFDLRISPATIRPTSSAPSLSVFPTPTNLAFPTRSTSSSQSSPDTPRLLHLSPPPPSISLLPPPPQPRAIDIQGPLSFRSSASSLSGYKTRWAVLHQNSTELLLFQTQVSRNPADEISLQGCRVLAGPGLNEFQIVAQSQPDARKPKRTYSFRVSLEEGGRARAYEWMKAVMKATVEKQLSRPVYSSMASPVISLGEAQEQVMRALLPEEWRERRLSGVGSGSSTSLFVEG